MEWYNPSDRGERRDMSVIDQPVFNTAEDRARAEKRMQVAGQKVLSSICKFWALGTVVFACLDTSAHAQGNLLARDGEVRVEEVNTLNFGSFVVMRSGTRTVGPDGSLTDTGVLRVSGEIPRPAQFKVVYDRGGPSRLPLDIEISIVLPQSLTFNRDGLVASLAKLKTDQASQSASSNFQLKIARCQTRLCSASFRVGGSLAVSQALGSGSVTISIPVTATITSRSVSSPTYSRH